MNASTLLRLDGPDALDVLHRVTTQSLRDLAPGRCAMTLACDFRGRLLHRFAVARGLDGTVWLARDDAPAESLSGYLDRQIFREKVTVVDVGGVVTMTVGDESMEIGDVRWADGRPAALRPEPRFALRAGGDGAPSSEIARLRAGIPRHGYEITDDFHALEVGLAADVHLDKGCFTGQEALLRMITYGGVRRRLVLLEGAGAPPEPRSALRAAGEPAGVVTHTAADGAHWVGLGVMKRAAAAIAAEIETDSGLARCTTFPETRPAGLPEARPA